VAASGVGTAAAFVSGPVAVAGMVPQLARVAISNTINIGCNSFLSFGMDLLAFFENKLGLLKNQLVF
jgi:hypothetical protein